MFCNEDIHDETKTMEYAICPFCNNFLIEYTTKIEACCQDVKIHDDNFMIVCVNCGQVEGFEAAKEYINFYKNRSDIVKKPVYHRHYHVKNTITDISSKNKI